MKKIFYLSMLAILMCSCSKDKKQEDVSYVLVRKMVTYDLIYTAPISFTLTYFDGNKLISMTNPEGLEIMRCYYEGDLIKKIVYPFNHEMEYEYDPDGRLINYKEYTNSTDLHYNENGIVDMEINPFTNNQYFDRFYIEGQIVRKSGTLNSSTYTYDGRHYPFKNIRGFDKIFLSLPFRFLQANYSYAKQYESTQNLVSTDTANWLSPGTFNYAYNTADYPTKREITYQSNTYTTEFYYQ